MESVVCLIYNVGSWGLYKNNKRQPYKDGRVDSMLLHQHTPAELTYPLHRLTILEVAKLLIKVEQSLAPD